VLQSALVYINTLMVQYEIAQPAWTDMLMVEDKRGLTPLIWAHVSPYGEIRLDMQDRLQLAA
jgi:Tn3 transposase DDE domain